jgi:hypothetical protein
MTESIILERLASIEPDWADVERRSRRLEGVRRIPKRAAVATGVAAVAATVTAVAFGLPQTIIDFFASPTAPAHVKNWFGAENVAAPPGMNPRAIPGQARKIATAAFDVNHLHGDQPTAHTLYVAPRKGGGFCYVWTKAGGGCLPAKPSAESAAMGPLDVSWFAAGDGQPVLVDGWVRTGATKTVKARFADGTTAPVPVTWVSRPIDAGFFVYPVPLAHRTRADALASVVALDASGKVLGRQSFPLTKPLDEDVVQTLPDGTKESLPRRAQAARARKVVSFRATDGSMVYLWVMPRTGGGVCFVFDQGEGCEIPHLAKLKPVFNAGLSGGSSRILLFGQAKPEVATVELRYENGESQQLTPSDGFVLTEITPAHYRRGTRLVSALALDASGKAIYTVRFQPQSTGLYPCKKPVAMGYGVKTCP